MREDILIQPTSSLFYPELNPEKKSRQSRKNIFVYNLLVPDLIN